MKMIILEMIIIISATFLLTHFITQREYERGFKDGVLSVPKPTPNPSVSLLQKDQICSAWLFQTNIKQAKKRICGGRT